MTGGGLPPVTRRVVLGAAGALVLSGRGIGAASMPPPRLVFHHGSLPPFAIALDAPVVAVCDRVPAPLRSARTLVQIAPTVLQRLSGERLAELLAPAGFARLDMPCEPRPPVLDAATGGKLGMLLAQPHAPRNLTIDLGGFAPLDPASDAMRRVLAALRSALPAVEIVLPAGAAG